MLEVLITFKRSIFYAIIFLQLRKTKFRCQEKILKNLSYEFHQRLQIEQETQSISLLIQKTD